MRRHPQYQAPLHRYPKVTRDIPAAMRAKRTSFGDRTPGNGRRQCTATAKSTGKQCLRDPVCHAPTCRSHGGVGIALLKLQRLHGPKIRRAASNAQARATLFRAGMNPPKGFTSDAKGLERGRQAEAFRNKFHAL